MRDPIDSLNTFDPGESVKPLPAAEIRRRGDARRRRRTATTVVGAVAAAAAVIVPVALLNQSDTPNDPATGGTETEQTTEPTTPEPTGDPAAVVTAIPEEFPIEIGLSTRDATAIHGPAQRGQTGATTEPYELCGVQIWPAGGVDTLDVYVEAPTWWESRQLATYTSQEEAAAVLAEARDAVTGCESALDGQAVDLLNSDVGDDEVTFGLSSATGQPGGSVVQLVRVGSAVLLADVSTELTPDILQETADDLSYATAEIAQHMCVFTPDGCSTLDSVPLDRYLPSGEDFEQVDPNAEGADLLLVCGEEIWPTDALQSYGVMVIGPEQSEARTLSEWGEADLAAAALEHARSVVESCSGGDTEIIVLDGDTGYDTLTYAEVQASGQPGGVVVQLMRVNELLLVSVSGGEFTADSVQDAAAELTAQSADLATDIGAISGG